MGGGKEAKKTNNMIDQDRAQGQAEHTNYMGSVNAGLGGAQGRANDMYNVQFQGLSDFATGGQDYKGAPGGGGGGGGVGLDARYGDVENQYREFMKTGGVDRTKFDESQGHLSELAKTGGWSPERMASMDQNISGLKDIGRTGGIDAAGQARMRGGGVFDEFSQTGGLDAGARQNIRQRGTSGIPAMYGQMRNEVNRMGAVQGGYGPGRAALMGKMGREQAGAAQSAALDSELGIQKQVNEGRQWGAGNMASSEAGLQGQLVGNRLAGLNGAGAMEGNMVNSIAGNRQTAANSGSQNELGMQGLTQSGRQWGTQGLEGIAGAATSLASQNASRGDADARWQAGFNREGRQYGLDQMGSLYGSKPGEVDMYLGANLEGRQLNSNNNQGQYDARMQNNPRRDVMGTIAGLAGAAGGVMTGLGGMGLGKNTGIRTPR